MLFRTLIPLLFSVALITPPASAQPDSYEPIFQITGENQDSFLGAYMSTCGDQNGDGCDEFLISNENPGEVMMFYGGTNLDTIPDMIFGIGRGKPRCITFGENIRSTEHGEILITHILNGYLTMYMYDCGSELDTIPEMIFQGPNQYSDGFGVNVGIEDINDDGWNDIVTAAYQYDPGSGDRGRLYVFYGGADMDTIPDFTITAAYNDFGDRFGIGLACGDVNGDGYSDILAMTALPTKAWLFYGGAELDSIPDWSYQALPPVYLNTSCLIVPNFNGDQYADMFFHDNTYFSYVFFGAQAISSQPNQILNEAGSVQKLAGDLNDDGFGDIVGLNMIGVKITYGSLSGAINGETVITPDAPYGTGYCGDVNGDGFDDIAYYSQEPFNYGQMGIYADTTLSSVHYDPAPVASSFGLYQNYPNPFNNSTTIPFTLNRAGKVELRVYDVLGRRVWGLGSRVWEAGMHEVVWDAEGTVSGVYLLRLSVEGMTDIPVCPTRKVVLLK